MSLIIDELSVRIPRPDGKQVHAVTDASVNAVSGRTHYIVGGSGSGKSTLLAAVTGLLTAAAVTSGDVSARIGSRMYTWPDLRPGRIVGIVPQSPTTSFTPVRRLGSQLAETVRCLGGERSPEELLEHVGLESDALRRYPFELSGGMAQRAAVAAALAGDPPILLADEPTASLDHRRSREVLGMLTALAGSDRIVVVATHDLAAVRTADAANTADVSVMLASRVVETGPVSTVLTSPGHEYTRDLLAALPENGLHRLPHPIPDLVDLPDSYRYGATP